MRQLLLQRRQRLLHLRQRRFLRHHVELGDCAKLALTPQQIEHVALDLDDALRRRDLAAQRGLLDGRAGEIGRQGQIGRFEREALRSPPAPRSASIERRVPPKTSGE